MKPKQPRPKRAKRFSQLTEAEQTAVCLSHWAALPAGTLEAVQKRAAFVVFQMAQKDAKERAK